jgi:hypothetical protein
MHYIRGTQGLAYKLADELADEIYCGPRSVTSRSLASGILAGSACSGLHIEFISRLTFSQPLFLRVEKVSAG